MRDENKAQEIEIGALKFELAKTRAAAGSEEQAGPDGDGVQVEVNSQDGEPELGEAEKSKEKCGLLMSPTSFNEALHENTDSLLGKILPRTSWEWRIHVSEALREKLRRMAGCEERKEGIAGF